MLPYTNTCFYATPPTLYVGIGEHVVVLYTPIAMTIKHYNETLAIAIYMIVLNTGSEMSNTSSVAFSHAHKVCGTNQLHNVTRGLLLLHDPVV